MFPKRSDLFVLHVSYYLNFNPSDMERHEWNSYGHVLPCSYLFYGCHIDPYFCRLANIIKCFIYKVKTVRLQEIMA